MTSREIFEYGLTRRTPEELQAHPDFSHVTRRPWCGCERSVDGFASWHR